MSESLGSMRCFPTKRERKGRTEAVDGYVLRDATGWTWKANGRDNEGRFDFIVAEVAYGTGPSYISTRLRKTRSMFSMAH